MANQSEDRVRDQSSESVNNTVDEATLSRLRGVANSPHEIDRRISEVESEWDIERVLELNASAVAFTGILLGAFAGKKWLALPAMVSLFLAQHAIQGWCPPLPLFRRLGFRSRQEIDREKYALKALRGDFKKSNREAELAWRAVNK